MLRRIGVLASLAVVATMFAGISSAQAAPSAGVCVFQGLAGTLTPAIPNAVPDLTDGGSPLDVERGRYIYNGTGATCAGVFEGSPDVGNVAINSAGYYDNLICGTGFAHDLDGNETSVVGTGTLGTSINVTGAGYQIPFVAGVGPILIGPNGAPALPGIVTPGTHSGATGADANHSAVSSAWTGAGVVQITPGRDTDAPATRDNCITPAGTPAGNDGNTGSFQVKGFFVAAKP